MRCEGRWFSLNSLKKNCSSEKYLSVDKDESFGFGNNNGHSDCTKKKGGNFPFLACYSYLWYLQISLWNLIPFFTATLLPWVKMTELISLQVPLFEMWPAEIHPPPLCSPDRFRPEWQTDLPLSTQPGHSYLRSATSFNLVRVLMSSGTGTPFLRGQVIMQWVYFY